MPIPGRPISSRAVRELRDMGRLALGFLPWLIFLFFAGHSLESLERVIWVCLAASVVFGFRDLRSGFILQWGTLVFFVACAVLVNGMRSVWVAENMSLLANACLAGIVWVTLLAGRPFALQYARRELPRERWNDPSVLSATRFITLVWALLMTLSVAVSAYRMTLAPQAPEGVYFALSLAIIFGGMLFTALFKRQQRMRREAAAATPQEPASKSR